jgi:hypothetical protein
MEWHWPLAVVVLGVLLFAYCTYSLDRSSRDLDRALESLDKEACYQAGYNAGLAGLERASASDDNPGCASSFEEGFADGRRVYDAYDHWLD